MENQIQTPQANQGPRPDMILGVRYEEYKPETYAGIEVEPLAKGEGDTLISGRLFNSGRGFEADVEDARAWLNEHGLIAVCRSSFDHFQSDRKGAA